MPSKSSDRHASDAELGAGARVTGTDTPRVSPDSRWK
jgi:hypothetical protein